VVEAQETGASVLLVDDEEVFRERLARAFRDRGYRVGEVGDVRGVEEAARALEPDYAVVDLRLPSGSGLDVVRIVKRLCPQTTIVVLTGYGSIATALEAVALGATHYLSKPAGISEILAALTRDSQASDTTGRRAIPVPSLARVEWEHIHRVLADVDGNVSEAARRLGIHRRSLQRKLSKNPTRR